MSQNLEIQRIYALVKDLDEHLKLNLNPELKDDTVDLGGLWVRGGDPDVEDECFSIAIDTVRSLPGFVIERGVEIYPATRWDPPDYDVIHITTVPDAWSAAKWLILYAIEGRIDNIWNADAWFEETEYETGLV
jgi:hypothetical protein